MCSRNIFFKSLAVQEMLEIKRKELVAKEKKMEEQANKKNEMLQRRAEEQRRLHCLESLECFRIDSGN